MCPNQIHGRYSTMVFRSPHLNLKYKTQNFSAAVHIPNYLNSWRHLLFWKKIIFYLWVYLDRCLKSASSPNMFFFLSQKFHVIVNRTNTVPAAILNVFEFFVDYTHSMERKRNALKQIISKSFNFSYFFVSLAISISRKSMCTVRSCFYEYNGMDRCGDIPTGSLYVCVLD